MEYRFLWFVSTCNIDFEANSTSLMSLWANIKFFPEPTGELYGWLLATLVIDSCENLSPSTPPPPHPSKGLSVSNITFSGSS